MDITISGVDEIQALLRRAPARVVRNSMARALAAAAVPVVRALEPRIPVDTGDLAKHLMTDIAIDADGRGGTAQIGFGKEGWKARLVEYGHRELGHEPDKKDLGTVAHHPFMGPAAMASADAAVEAFTEVLSESLRDGDALKHAS
jgi:HK97 gp10 family phage protein